MVDYISAFRDSIFDTTHDLSTDYLEIGLDALMESGILKELPIVKTITCFYQIGQNMYQRNQLKQTLAFIQGFNAKELNREKIERYKEKIFYDSQKCEEELGRVMIILDHHIDRIQSKVLGSFFYAYVCGSISWPKFCELAEANRRMFVVDYTLIKAMINDSVSEIDEDHEYQYDRLISLGLIKNESIVPGSGISGGSAMPIVSLVPSFTSFGKTFYTLMGLGA